MSRFARIREKVAELAHAYRATLLPAAYVSAAALLAVLLGAWGQQASFVPFIAAVVVGAWLGGLYGGLLTTALSAGVLTLGYALAYHPTDSVGLQEFFLRLGLFAFMGLAASYLAMQCHRAISAHERLQKTLTLAGEAWVFADVRGRVNYLNALAQAWSGWHLAHAARRPLDQLFVLLHETSRKPIPIAIEQIVKLRAPIRLPEDAVLLTASGSTVPVEGSILPIQNSADEVVEVLLMFREASSVRKEAARQVEQLRIENQSLREQHSRDQEALRQMQAEVEAQEKQLSELTAHSEQLRKQIQELQRQRDEESASRAAAERQGEQERRRLQQRIKDLEAEIQTHRGQKTEDRGEVERLQKALEEERRNREAAEQARLLAEKTAKELEADLESAWEVQEKLEQVTGECQRLQERLVTLQEQADRAKAEFEERLRAERERATQAEGECQRLTRLVEEREAALVAEQQQARDRLAALGRALESVEQRQRLLESVLHSLPCGVVAVDAAGKVAYSNPAADRLVGREPGDRVGDATNGDRLALAANRVEVYSAPWNEGGKTLLLFEMAEPPPAARQSEKPRRAVVTQDADWLAYN